MLVSQKTINFCCGIVLSISLLLLLLPLSNSYAKPPLRQQEDSGLITTTITLTKEANRDELGEAILSESTNDVIDGDTFVYLPTIARVGSSVDQTPTATIEPNHTATVTPTPSNTATATATLNNTATPTVTPTTTGAQASTCADNLTAFTPYSDLVTATCEDGTMQVHTTTGLPNLSPSDERDKIMVDITAWILRVPIPYNYQWQIPITPTWLPDPTYEEASPKGPIAFAVNGVPIFHYEARPDASTDPDDYNPGTDTVLRGELDQCGGHSGQGDDYHYHYPPICLLDIHDLSKPIAFSLDGAPIYFGTGGNDYYGDGRYSTINNLPETDLDKCNAWQLEDGSYVYYTTADPPYVIGCHRAEFDSRLQIEPRPLTGRGQGTANPYGGQFGEPTTTLITDYYVDSSGTYHLEHEAFSGSTADTSATIYYKAETGDDCWVFEYREDVNTPGVTNTYCRNNNNPSPKKNREGSSGLSFPLSLDDLYQE